VNEPTNWDKLGEFLYTNWDKGKVSVSGGGDCLYKYDEHIDWWRKLFGLTSTHMLVDVHTREKFYSTDFWLNINRCVFSSDQLEDDIEYLKYLTSLVKLRVTHLVTAETTFEMIENFLTFQDEVLCQFTIKELIGFPDGGMYKKVREKYSDIYFLDKGDYNTYYMPDNSIRDSFLKGEIDG
jgi:hypothetical protein